MRRRARKGGGRQAEVTITAIGARGDGNGMLDGQAVFVPFTVPGDRVLARVTGARAGSLRAEILELVEEGPGRAAPPCPHFGLCGGCALQHLSDAHYAEWKQSLVHRALAQRGIDGTMVAPMRRVGAQSRRRMAFAAAKAGGRVHLGLHQRASHAVVDMETCLLVTPRLLALLPPMRTALASLLADGEQAGVTVHDYTNKQDSLMTTLMDVYRIPESSLQIIKFWRKFLRCLSIKSQLSEI